MGTRIIPEKEEDDEEDEEGGYVGRVGRAGLPERLSERGNKWVKGKNRN